MAAIKRLLEAHANAPAASSATFQQSGGKMTGIGAIGSNTGKAMVRKGISPRV